MKIKDDINMKAPSIMLVLKNNGTFFCLFTCQFSSTALLPSIEKPCEGLHDIFSLYTHTYTVSLVAQNHLQFRR